MKLAVLFWFYKEPEICKNRLELIRKHNPELKIYGLYGGEIEKASEYKLLLNEFLDDFYISPFAESEWKWINGDLMILDWFENRGKGLSWNSVAVVQWDLLVFDSFENIFPGLQENQLYLSGTIPLTKEVEENWDWTQTGGKERKNYLAFLEYVKEVYDFAKQPLCCLFVFQIFPRKFLEQYSKVEDRALGMLEYKVPVYAQIFEAPMYEKDLGVWWFDDSQKWPMNALPEVIEKEYIQDELSKPNGWRMFHPYYKIWNN